MPGSHKDIIDMIIDNETKENIKYESIIITRFDLYYYQKLTEIDIDYNVFNIPFWHMNGTMFSVEDNLIIFPGNISASKFVLKKTFMASSISLMIGDP